MTQSDTVAEREVRLRTYNSFQQVYGTAPIRLMSRTVSEMRSLGYNDLPSAIGDLDWRTVSVEDDEDPRLWQDWGSVLTTAFEHLGSWCSQLSAKPMGYNLDSVGYRPVINAWSALWSFQLGISFENLMGELPQVYLFHGGNQALQGALLGIVEAHRERLGTDTPATVLVPIPTFSCPLDQLALQGIRVALLPPREPSFDPSVADLDQLPGDVDVDGVYLMPVNNPTGRTLSPELLQAYVDAVLARWPHAGIILDSVYVRLHPAYRGLLSWFNQDSRYRDSVMFVDSLSKTHGVTGLRAGVLLTAAPRFAGGILRYAQNVMAGPSNVMQAAMMALLAPFLSGDDELKRHRVNLQMRIGRHLQRRRKLLLRDVFTRFGRLLDSHQPVLPDPVGFDWQGSMYADLRMSDQCIATAARRGLPPTILFYLETGVGAVPLCEGFCRNPGLERHRLVVNQGSSELEAFLAEAGRYLRLSFGMTPAPRG